MMTNMDLDQEGPVSSEDRLFMGAKNNAVQPNNQQVNPFGAVRWEGGKPLYQPMETEQATSEQQQLQQQCLQQQQMMLQHQQQIQQQQLLIQQQQLHQQQQQCQSFHQNHPQ